MNPRVIVGCVAVVLLAACGVEEGELPEAPQVASQTSELITGCRFQTGPLYAYWYAYPGESVRCPTWALKNTRVHLYNSDTQYSQTVMLRAGAGSSSVWVGPGGRLTLDRFYGGWELTITPMAPVGGGEWPGIRAYVE